MRKHHNRLFFGKYTHKAVFKVPNIAKLYPTTDYYIEKNIKNLDKSSGAYQIGTLILEERKNFKFRIQNNSFIMYGSKELILNQITKLWDYWTGVVTTDPNSVKVLDNETVICRRLPLGKFAYQVHTKRNMYDKISIEQRKLLFNYLTLNPENATITNSNLKQWLSGQGAIHYDLNGYFYVKDEKSLLPVYMISKNIVSHIRKFVKIK